MRGHEDHYHKRVNFNKYEATLVGDMMLPLLLLLLDAASAFNLCPSPCLCYESSDLVNCRSRGLDQVPPSVPHGTWLLDLSGNKVKEVRTGSFMGLWSLKILLMSNNSMNALHPQVWKLQPSMTMLLHLRQVMPQRKVKPRSCGICQ